MDRYACTNVGAYGLCPTQWFTSHILLIGDRREMATVQTIKYALITLAGATGIFVDTVFVVI